ncbi:MAG: CHRD domain-containing protein [Rhodospirillales bacterium]|nr:CHRD domain-containing protein [Rhodospirillales bacterium]
MSRLTLVLGVFLAIAGCSFYPGEPRLPKTDFRATLNGASEVPPTDSRGSGYFAAVYRPSTKVLEYRLNLVRLSGPVTMAYLQGPAAPGENAPRVVPIDIPFYADRSTIDDGVTLTEQQAGEVLAGRWYVNVMTEKYPDGEIRGQILPLKK